MGRVSSEYAMPLIGGTAVDHQGEFYVALGASNKAGNRISMSEPIHDCSVGAFGHFGAFKLLRELSSASTTRRVRNTSCGFTVL